MNVFLLLTAVSLTPVSGVEDHFDKIELNHFYDEDGRHVLSQIVCWDKNEDCEYTVQAWGLFPVIWVKLTQAEQDHNANLEEIKKGYNE